MVLSNKRTDPTISITGIFLLFLSLVLWSLPLPVSVSSVGSRGRASGAPVAPVMLPVSAPAAFLTLSVLVVPPPCPACLSLTFAAFSFVTLLPSSRSLLPLLSARAGWGHHFSLLPSLLPSVPVQCSPGSSGTHGPNSRPQPALACTLEGSHSLPSPSRPPLPSPSGLSHPKGPRIPGSWLSGFPPVAARGVGPGSGPGSGQEGLKVSSPALPAPSVCFRAAYGTFPHVAFR